MSPPRVQPAPIRGSANALLGLGAFVSASSLGMLAFGHWTASATGIVWGAVVLVAGWKTRRAAEAVPLLNTAYNAAQEGRVADASALLDDVEARFSERYFRRLADVQRAEIAWRSGDLDAALARADAAVAGPMSFTTRAREQAQALGARGLRAMILAAKGERDRARADIAAVRASADSPLDARVRAEVAEAIVLERSGDRDALAAHLVAERRLLLQRTVPRERAVLRAYQRMLRATQASVYRKPASRDAEQASGAEPTVADWIASISPAAAPFATATPRSAVDVAAHTSEAPIAPDLRRAAEERLQGTGVSAKMAKRPGMLFVIWLGLMGFFVVAWQLMNPSAPAQPVPAPALGAGLTWLAVGLPLLLGALVGGRAIARIRKVERRLLAALQSLARGEVDAEEEVEALTHASEAMIAAQASLALAQHHEQHADFAEARSYCEAGIAAVIAQPATRAAASTALLPNLVAERAFLLAATDATNEARAEMEALAASFPSYPRLAAAELRVALIRLARGGDLVAAARLSAGRGEDLALPRMEETLADVVRAAVHPEATSAGEIDRLAEELRQDAELRGWLTAVAPRAASAFDRATQGAEPEGNARVDADAMAEREAMAEEEAMAAREAMTTR